MKIVFYADNHTDMEGPKKVEGLVEELLKQHAPKDLVICTEDNSDEFTKRVFAKGLKGIMSGEYYIRHIIDSPVVKAAHFDLLKVFAGFAEKGVRIFPVDMNTTTAKGIDVLMLGHQYRDLEDRLGGARSFDRAFVAYADMLKLLQQGDAIRNPDIFENISAVIAEQKPECVVVVYGGAHIPYLKQRFDALGYNTSVRNESVFESLDTRVDAAVARGCLTEEDRLEVARGLLLAIGTSYRTSASKNEMETALDQKRVTKLRGLVDKVKSMDEARGVFDSMASGEFFERLSDKAETRTQKRLRELGIPERRPR